MTPDLIATIQTQLESLYSIRTGQSATDYLISNEELAALLPKNKNENIPKELFLVNPNPEDDTVEVALYLDPDLRANLSTHNPLNQLDKKNIGDFCSLIEGVSHFVYYIHKASLDFSITQLELEMQAEIDKFLLLSLMTEDAQQNNETILEVLFEGYHLHDELSLEQIDRYHTASDLARKYCFALSKRIVNNQLPELVSEVRHFYPLTQEQKIRHICL